MNPNEAISEMRIAVLGWGSLIWCPGALRMRTLWQPDGPRLPIEFARISQDDRLTLVIHAGSPEQPTYWAVSESTTLSDARANLRMRERTNASDIHFVVRDGLAAEGASTATVRIIREWLTRHADVGAVVWTGLPSNWQEKRGRDFTPEDAVRFLSDLEAARDNAKAVFDRAREYVTNTPSLVDSPVRRAMRNRGWRDAPLSSTLFGSTIESAPASKPAKDAT